MATVDSYVKFRIDDAIAVASRSTLKTFKTGAIITRHDGVALSKGWSHMSELQKFSQYRSIHAELHAILRSRWHRYTDTTVIYIATIRTKSGNIGMAKPCEFCQALLYEVGIKTAFYTIGEGRTYERMEIS